MNFREYISRAASEVLDYIRNRRADVSRSGQGWCQQLNICNRKCLFKGMAVANKGAGGFWVFVCDDSGEGNKPAAAPIFVPAASTWSLDWTLAPRLMMNGIYVCAPTDPVTKTLIAGADAWFEVAYEILPS